MNTAILALALVPVLLYHHARRGAWVLWALAVAALAGLNSTGTLQGALGVSVAGALLLTLVWLPGVRRPLWVRPLMRAVRREMPPISRTEREALEAGNTWWEAELFRGRPDWRHVDQIPAPDLSPTEQAYLDGPVEHLCRMLDDWELSQTHDLPPKVWRYLRDERFFGLIIPTRYGGLGFSAHAHSAVVQKVASRSIAAAVTVMVPNSLGPAELLLHYGTEAQRDHYLPRLARGEEIPCFGLTGPHAGSDAAAIPDEGVVVRGPDGEPGIRLNFEKRYITLAPVATLVGLAFRLRDPEGLLGGAEERGITLALLPADTPGVHIGRRHRPMDVPFQNGPIQGRDVFVPLDRIIGGRAGVGRGWVMLMERLATGRAISLPALSVATGKLASRAVGAYAAVRRQFHQPLGHFEGVQEPLARMAGTTYLCDAARELTLSALDRGERPAVVSGLLKYQLTEHMRAAVNDAMDVLGGAGIMVGPRNIMAHAYQAIPIAITVEGANILTRSLIVFGQGALRCHPHLLPLVQALEEPNGYGERRFEQALAGWMRHFGGNLVRAPWLTLRDALWPASDPERRLRQRVERLSAAFALGADWVLLTQGGAVKRREALSGRLADTLANLYLASAALVRFAHQGRPAGDRPLLEWSVTYALDRGEAALDGLLRNLPGRVGRSLLRRFALPLGRRCAPPADRLGRQVANVLLHPSCGRDRLTAGIFLPTGDQEPLGRLERALWLTCETEPLERRLNNAVRHGHLPRLSGAALAEAAGRAGVLAPEEADRLAAAFRAREAILPVDSFPSWPTDLSWRTRHEPDHLVSARPSGVSGGRRADAVS